MARVFQNIDPPPPSPPGECVRGEDTLAGWRVEGGGGSIFWKTPDTATRRGSPPPFLYV
jgi:hypothetical protein